MRVAIAVALSLAVCLVRTNAQADVIVIGSDVAAYKSGMKLPDDPLLEIPRCQSVLLRTADGSFRRVAGGYSGKLSAYRLGMREPCFEAPPSERQNFYVEYFHGVCEKADKCDDVCKEVYQKIDDKTELKLGCEK